MPDRPAWAQGPEEYRPECWSCDNTALCSVCGGSGIDHSGVEPCGSCRGSRRCTVCAIDFNAPETEGLLRLEAELEPAQ
jgi:hypothetical protein